MTPITITKITIGIVASLTGVVAYDDLTLTSTEVQQVREMVDFTPNEDLIYKTILLDKKNVEFDLSKITKKEVDDMLLSVMLKLGDTREDIMKEAMKEGRVNFDKRIKDKSKEKTSILRII